MTDLRDPATILLAPGRTLADVLAAHQRWLLGDRLWDDPDRARLVGAHLVGASLVGASLVGARLDRAHLDGASLVGASLDRASLVGARLDRARLDGASLVGASLESADLSRVDVDDLKKNSDRLAERWALSIRPGDAAPHSQIAELTARWLISDLVERPDYDKAHPFGDAGSDARRSLDQLEAHGLEVLDEARRLRASEGGG